MAKRLKQLNACEVRPCLPLEIIEEIVNRLPPKSLGRLRCVSKPWRTFVSTHKFVKTYLHKRRNLTRVVTLYDHSLYSIELPATRSHENHDLIAEKLCFYSKRHQWKEIHGSCNGLVLVMDVCDKLFLLNPTTGQAKKLPPSLPVLNPYNRHVEIKYGLGYDGYSDDYKVVKVVHAGGIYFHCVYKLKENCWRSLPKSARGNGEYDVYDNHMFSPGTFTNGYLHWLARRKTKSSWVVITFSLGSETFAGELALPNDPLIKQVSYWKCSREPRSYWEGKLPPFSHSLRVLGGSLCYVMFKTWQDTDVWVMKQYRTTQSWTKISVVDSSRSSVRPICLVDNEEEILFNGYTEGSDKGTVFEEESLLPETTGSKARVVSLSFNADEPRCRYMHVTGIPYVPNVTWVYVESLFLLNAH